MMKHLGDITKIDWFQVEPVDVVTGGSPCQDLSVAGKRAGLAGERSGLYMEQIRCVKELRQADVLRGRTGVAIRPRFMAWENVPGAFSSGKPKGADFAAVIEEIIKICEPGAAVHIVPSGDGWTKSGCYYADDGRWSIAWRLHDAQFWGVPQRRKRIALVADFGGLAAPEVLFERKGLSGDFEPGEPQGEEAAGGIGDGAYPAVARSLTARFGGSPCIDRVPNIVITDYTALVMAHGQANAEICKDLSPTLNCDHEQPIFVPAAAHALKAKANCQFREDSETYIVTAVDCRNGTENQDVNGTLQAKSTGGMSVNLRNVARVGQTVRRLTPLECERLQGYPDGWTDIGDWTDTKGKRHKEADSPRYKALGNSIALPFWCWLAKRISAQYERDVTMGSLFDGIGGFPYAFEKCNGKGTARWASEIEEFPIAVTKRRFAET